MLSDTLFKIDLSAIQPINSHESVEVEAELVFKYDELEDIVLYEMKIWTNRGQRTIDCRGAKLRGANRIRIKNAIYEQVMNH